MSFQADIMGRGFKLFDYSKNTEEVSNRFLSTKLYHEIEQLAEHAGANSALKDVKVDSEICAALFEFDVSKLTTSMISLEFIDLKTDRSLWLEIVVSPHKLLEADVSDLEMLDFEEMFLNRGGIKEHGWW